MRARRHVDRLDPAHDVAADRQGVNIGQQRQHRELSETQNEKTPPGRLVFVVVEAQQHAKARPQRGQRVTRRRAATVGAAKRRGVGFRLEDSRSPARI
jgi:hypothetical protein